MSLPLEERLTVFLKAAELMARVHRYDMMAKTMLVVGKTVWQAEIDCSVELIDFWQFAAIGANLPSIPAIVGNGVVWKPSSTSILQNYYTFQILREAGLPDGVINFIPTRGATIAEFALKDPALAAVHFTGSTEVFNTIWRTVATNMENYRGYPRLVGETGGKNFHFIHPTADFETAFNNTIRGAFEFQGQKCSACSRLYVPKSDWPKWKAAFQETIPKLKMGQPDEFDSFLTAVIDRASFENTKSYIDHARESPDAEIIAGGTVDDSRGYFVTPTVVLTTDPHYKSMEEEIFAPVLTVYVYDDSDTEGALRLCDSTSAYG